MSREIEVVVGQLKKTRVLVAVSLLMAVSLTAIAEDQNTAAPSVVQRLSESLHFSKHGRANNREPEKGELSVDQYDVLSTGGDRSKSAAQLLSGKPTGSVSRTPISGFWIFSADVILFGDDDGDGYFHGIDLLFDADTIFSIAEVYAVVYLSLEGGPWNEYAVTDTFTLFGTSANDEYNLVTELMSAYPSGDYDLLIELFDANDGLLLASFGPDDTSALAFLPLEDFNRDAPVVEQRVSVSHGGGGAASICLLLGLFATRLISKRAG